MNVFASRLGLVVGDSDGPGRVLWRLLGGHHGEAVNLDVDTTRTVMRERVQDDHGQPATFYLLFMRVHACYALRDDAHSLWLSS